MKCFRCSFCLLLVCVLSLGAFSSSVSASDDNLVLYQIHKFNNQNINGLVFKPNNDTIEKQEKQVVYGNTIPSGLYENRLQIYNENQDLLSQKGRKFSLAVNNFYFSALVECVNDAGVQMRYLVRPDYVQCTVEYTDGTTELVKDDRVSYVFRKDKCLNMLLEITPDKDIQRVYFRFYTDLSKYGFYDTPNIQNYKVTYYSGEYDGDDKFQIVVNVSSEELGLLEKIVKTVTDVKDGITELPNKIGNFIIEGIKSLFIPSDEFIVQFKEDLNALLSKKLGAVYQVIDILANTWDSIQESTVNQSIKFPEVTINLPDDNEFSFGGYDVKVVPDGFDFIVDSVKLITGVIATLLFVNGLKKRYDEVMGG